MLAGIAEYRCAHVQTEVFYLTHWSYHYSGSCAISARCCRSCSVSILLNSLCRLRGIDFNSSVYCLLLFPLYAFVDYIS